MLGAIPFIDGATYSFDEFYRRSFVQIAKAAGHHIVFQRTGNPRFSDPLYREMRTPEQAEEDDRHREQWEREFSTPEAEEYQRINECLECLEEYELKPKDLPCFVFVTRGGQRAGLLRIDHRWYESEPSWGVFLRCFCTWLEREDVKKLAIAELEAAKISSRLSRLLGELAQTVDEQMRSPHAASVPRVPAGVALDDHGWYTPSCLAESFGVPREALRKRLDRFRSRSLDGWKENEDRRPREAQYLYLLGAVKDIIATLGASGQRPAK